MSALPYLPGVAVPTRRSGVLVLAAGAAAVLVGGVAAVSPITALGLVLVLTFVAVTLRAPTIGLVLFTAMIFLEHVLFRFGAESFIKAAGAILAVSWAVQVVSRRGRLPLLVRDRPLVAGALAGLVLWALASSLWAQDSGVAASSALRLGQGVLLVFIVFTLLRELRHVRWLLSAYVVGALFSATYALVSVDARARLGGEAGNANDLAAFYLPAVIICAFMLLAERRPLVRLALTGAGLLLLFALLMTGSRGGLVGLLVALVAAVVVAGPARFRVVAATLVIAGGAIGYYAVLAPPEQVERLGAVRDDGGTGRQDLWSVALAVSRDHPLGGVGAGNFPVVEPRYGATELSIDRIDLVLDRSKVAHNTYLGVLSELGVVGLAAFAFVLGAAVAGIVTAIRRLRGREWSVQLPVRGFFVALVGILVAFTFTTSVYEKQLWLLAGSAIALPNLVRRERQPDLSGPSRAVDAERAADYDPLVFGGRGDAHGDRAPDDDGRSGDYHRLARREAALAERERAIERRERALRSGAGAGGGQATDAAKRIAELEARVEELERALARRRTQAPPPAAGRPAP